jgi:O-antigen ligase
MFSEKPWFGVSYRSTKALVFMAGVYISNRFNVSYSYDYALANLSNYNNGSHEVHFGLMLNKKDLKSPYLW